MPDGTTGKTEHIRQLCQRLKPILGYKMNQVFEAYCAEDAEGKQQIETYLELLTAKYLPANLDNTQPGLIPPSERQAQGPYTIGSVFYAGKSLYDFGLREKEWIQHVGVFGRSGAGKTNVSCKILELLHGKGKPVLVFDWKRNYRDLLVLPEFKDVEVYTIGRNIAPFTFNPLIPPEGTNPKTWLKKLIEVIAHAYLLGNGVMYLLQEAVDSVYEEAGVYSDTVESWPTFRDVLEKAKNRDARGREAGWLSSTLRALASLCFGDMDTLVNTGENQNLEHILKKTVILDLDALSQQDKIFFIEVLLLWFHHRRMIEKQRETFKHAILIEEAHHIFSGERRSLVGGQSVMEITFREIREFGESLIILDQHPSQISLPALGNTYCTICMNLKHKSDINAMAQCLLLDKERDLLGTLKVGQAIVKLQGRIARPFQITIPEFIIEKGTVTDAHIQERMQDIAPSTVEVHFSPESTATKSEITRAPDKEIAFLEDVQKHTESGVAARYKRLGLSVRQGQKLIVKLFEHGLIEQHKETTKTGRLKVIRLTEKGKALLSKPN
jgi:predicted transcriptional regulator